MLKSLPSSSGILTKDIEPIWNKVMQMNQISIYVTSILRITALACLLYFLYTLVTKSNSNIRKSLLSTTIYLILIVIIGVIVQYTRLILYWNTILLFGRSIVYIALIITIGTIREIFIKLKERGIENE